MKKLGRGALRPWFGLSLAFCGAAVPDWAVAAVECGSGSVSCQVADLAVNLKNGSGSAVKGRLMLPKGSAPYAAALFLYGADTPGEANEPTKNAEIHKLVQELGRRGVAVLRYDIGASSAPLETVVDESSLLLGKLKTDKRFKEIFVVGYGEGSLVGMLVARGGKTPFVSLNGSGRRAADLLRERLKPPVTTSAEYAEALRIIAKLELGETVDTTGGALAETFPPESQERLISLFKYDPAVEIKKVSTSLIIEEAARSDEPLDAEILYAAAKKPSAKCVIGDLSKGEGYASNGVSGRPTRLADTLKAYAKAPAKTASALSKSKCRMIGVEHSPPTEEEPPKTTVNPENEDDPKGGKQCIYQVATVKVNPQVGPGKVFGGKNLDCLQKILDDCGSDGMRVREAYDDGKIKPEFVKEEGDGRAFYDTDKCVADYFRAKGKGGKGPKGPKSVAYIDEGCRLVPKQDDVEVCGDVIASYIPSPVSLLWNESIRIEETQGLSKFPLDPSRQGNWFEWKASAETPLLVWDPAHTGRITSAEQLFGSFTFGKRWKNGYEALATLDTDRNGQVSDKELEALALWFDANRNGLSEEGEVRLLAAVGVTALYYAPVVPKGANLVASIGGGVKSEPRYYFVERGYRRTSGGRTIELPSVDWFAKGFESKFEAIGKLEE